MKKVSNKIAVLTLLTFLFSGIGSTSLFPILITALAHAHPVFISEDHHKIQLILHHPGNHDEHEAQEGMDHHHDLLDLMMGVPKSNPISHTDHTVELPSFEEKVSTTTKSFMDADTLSLLAHTPILPGSIQQKLERRLPHFLAVIDPHRAFHRTTILVI